MKMRGTNMYIIIIIIIKFELQKNKHYILSAKAYNLDPWISEPRLTEKLLHLKVNLGFIISWKKKIS